MAQSNVMPVASAALAFGGLRKQIQLFEEEPGLVDLNDPDLGGA